MLGAIIAAVILARWITPYDPLQQQPAQQLLLPSSAHLLGTDHFGRDILARLLYGGRSVLFVAFGAVAVALMVGAAAGMVAGYYRGRVETLIMRTVDLLLSFPLILLAIIIVVSLGPGVSNLIVAIAISQLPLFARLSHGLTLSIGTREFIEAAHASGAAGTRIIRVHILPNISAPLIVQAATAVAVAILQSSALNFLGLGIQPPAPDWGAMISDFRQYVFDKPYLPLYPGVAIALTVLSLNIFADGLATLLDPLNQRRLGSSR